MLKRLKNGMYRVGSKSDVAEARKRLDELEYRIVLAEVGAGIPGMREESVNLKTSLEKYLNEKLSAKESLEMDEWVATKVVGHKRTWNPDKLAKLAPKNLFLKMVNVVPDAEKIDQLVKAGKIDRDSIEPAFEETPNKPYIKWTKKREDQRAKHEDQAAELAGKLR